MQPIKFEVMPFGFRVSFKLYERDYNKKIFKANLLEIKKIIVAASGPITNLIMIIVIMILNTTGKENQIYANLLIMIFNLMPIYPLDGGRILKSVIHIFYGGKVALKTTNKISNALIIFVTALGSIAIFYFENIAIFLMVIFLWIIVIRENVKYKMIINAYNML